MVNYCSEKIILRFSFRDNEQKEFLFIVSYYRKQSLYDL